MDAERKAEFDRLYEESYLKLRALARKMAEYAPAWVSPEDLMQQVYIDGLERLAKGQAINCPFGMFAKRIMIDTLRHWGASRGAIRQVREHRGALSLLFSVSLEGAPELVWNASREEERQADARLLLQWLLPRLSEACNPLERDILDCLISGEDVATVGYTGTWRSIRKRAIREKAHALCAG